MSAVKIGGAVVDRGIVAWWAGKPDRVRKATA